jgi:hypothetical protein
MGRLSQVAYYFPSFTDVRGRWTWCDFLDLGDGVDLSPSHGTRLGLCRMWLPQRWNLSLDVLWAGKCCEKHCGDLLAVHQRKCTLSKMETSSRLASDEITNLMGKVVQPLQSVNCHDSRAHGLERHGPFTWLVEVWLVWICRVFWVQFIWFVVCSRCEACVHGLAIGEMHVSIVQFWLQVWLLGAWGPWLPWVI